MTDLELVELINRISFVAFWLLLFVGALSTIARVAYYRVHGFRRPRLLVRDALVIGGFAVSFGLILLVRVLRDAGHDVTPLSTALWWALVTSIPAIGAVAVYVWFELFVIERGGDHERDTTFLDPQRPEDD